MKTRIELIALLCWLFPALSFGQLFQNNCLFAPNHVVTVSGYPAPRVQMLTPPLCNNAGVVHTDSVNFYINHMWLPVCMDFGTNFNNSGRMGLCFARFVPNSLTSTFLTAPFGEALVIEVDLGKTPDMLYAWIFKNNQKVFLDSAVAVANGNIINGYQRMLEFDYHCEAAYPGDPNLHRLKVKVDGNVRMDFKYNLPNLLWSGKGTAICFLSGTAGPLSANFQAARLMAEHCAVRPLIPLKQADGRDEMPTDKGELQLDIFPNPATGGKVELRSNCEGEYMLYNLQGQLVRDGNLRGGQVEITVDDLPAGTYVLRYQGKEGKVIRKVALN